MRSYLSELSIIIVTYHGDDLLKQCLASLANACGSEPEIVVVDNSKSCDTEAIVKAYSNTKYVASETNLGFAGGNNLGLPHCTREYVLLLNNDTIIYQDSFSPVIDYMKNHPKVAVAGGTMRLAKKGNVSDVCGIMYASLTCDYVCLQEAMPINLNLSPHPVLAVKGAFLIFKRTIIEHLDGVLFYDHFKSYCEEVDFCHRVWLTGNEVHFVPTPYVDHLESQTSKRMNWRNICQQSYANWLFSLKTNLGNNYFKVMFWNALRISICVTIYLLKNRKDSFKDMLQSFKINKLRNAELRKTRKKLQESRKIYDTELFKMVSLKLPLIYYYYSIRGNTVKMQECVIKATGKLFEVKL